jgi:exonuclease-1
LNESYLPSPQTEDSGTPDSVDDTSFPIHDIEASQCSSERFSSEPSPDDSIKVPQCSAEHFSCAFPPDDSAGVSPYCSSRDIGSDPPSEDQYLEDTEVSLMTSA